MGKAVVRVVAVLYMEVRERGRERGREVGREEGRKGGREGGREEGREGGREREERERDYYYFSSLNLDILIFDNSSMVLIG